MMRRREWVQRQHELPAVVMVAQSPPICHSERSEESGMNDMGASRFLAALGMTARGVTRRDFLAAGLALAAAAPLRAIEPIVRHGPAQIKLSVAAYSFHKLLERKKDMAPKMVLEEFIDRAAEWGVPAVELTSYYFAETTPKYLTSLKRRCTRLGLNVSGGAVGNNFCVTDPAKLRKEIDSVKRGAEHVSLLGGQTLRIFAGTLANDDTEEKARARVVEAIQEACDHAAKVGVYLALENHGGITATADQLLALVTAVKHDWFGVNLDTGNFHTPAPYTDLARIAPYAITVQLKTQIERPGCPKEPADIPCVFGILKQIRYRGYVALEYEGEADPFQAVPDYLRQMQRQITGG
jgi:sugar phosphate isomerase/epimerase